MLDVCLLLEGTYPFVAGGVSTWVHQLLSAMRDIRFGIIYITPHSDPTRKPKYEVPDHVIYLKEISLHDYSFDKKRYREPKSRDYNLLKDFYLNLEKEDYSQFENVISLFRGDKSCIDNQIYFTSKEIWKLLEFFYNHHASNIPFLDFFWTWRGTQLPLMEIIHGEIPRAHVYHSISTGYAGLIGSIAKKIYNQKFFLTEHGIYTHERMLEISQATWIYDQQVRNFRAERNLSFFKKWWIAMFKVMSQITYENADKIFTLYEGNKTKEILEGADESKISIIPNGIDIRKFESIKREKQSAPQIALIGRIVSIKDVKTFIQACKFVSLKYPDAQFYAVGPTDEEEDYFEECKILVGELDLESQFTFTGRVDVLKYYSFVDLVILTSVSEAQPYVILEANLAGIPVVSTDVGACRELLNGREMDDQLLGPSGLITEVSSPVETSKAIIKFIEDKEFYNKCVDAGKKRVKKYYDQDDLLSRYLNIYEQNL